MGTSNDCFVAALQKKLKEQGRGAKKKLAARVGVSPNHLSDILGRRKNAGQKLKERIADALDTSFEDMLVLGRHIIEDMPSEVGDDGKETKDIIKQESIGTADLMTMAAKILETNTPYRQALTSNITAYHQALEFAQKEKDALKVITDLRKELGIMRQEIDELKKSEKSEEDSPDIAAA